MVAGLDTKADNYQYYEIQSDGYLDYTEKDYFFLYYKIKPTVNVEFVLNRKSSIQAFGRFFSSRIDITSFTDTVGTGSGLVDRTTFYPTDRAKAKSMSFGLKYRLFTNSALNPVGKYISFGLEYASNKFEFEEGQFYAEFNKLISRNPQNERVSTLVPTFGFGTQQSLGNSLILNIGAEFGLPFSILKSKEPYPSSEDWAKANAKNNFFRSYIFNITFGLAFMP